MCDTCFSVTIKEHSASDDVLLSQVKEFNQMQTIIQHTTNPKEIEIGIEFFLPTDAPHWIPNGFETISVIVDSEEHDDDPVIVEDEIAEAWCKSQGVVFSQVINEP
jgi:hypothetical protein